MNNPRPYADQELINWCDSQAREARERAWFYTHHVTPDKKEAQKYQDKAQYFEATAFRLTSNDKENTVLAEGERMLFALAERLEVNPPNRVDDVGIVDRIAALIDEARADDMHALGEAKGEVARLKSALDARAEVVRLMAEVERLTEQLNKASDMELSS